MGIVAVIFERTHLASLPELAHHCLIFVRVGSAHFHVIALWVWTGLMLRTLILPCTSHGTRLLRVVLLHLVCFIHPTVAVQLAHVVGCSSFCGERGSWPLRVDSAGGHLPEILVHTRASWCDLFHFFLDEFTLTWCCCQMTVWGLEIIRAGSGSALRGYLLTRRRGLPVVIIHGSIVGMVLQREVTYLISQHVVVWVVSAWRCLGCGARITIGPCCLFLMPLLGRIWMHLEQILLVLELDLDSGVGSHLSFVFSKRLSWDQIAYLWGCSCFGCRIIGDIWGLLNFAFGPLLHLSEIFKIMYV